MLYVFVDIKIDSLHFVETLKYNFLDEEDFPEQPRIALFRYVLWDWPMPSAFLSRLRQEWMNNEDTDYILSACYCSYIVRTHFFRLYEVMLLTTARVSLL